MKKPATKIDPLLEPLLQLADDDQSANFLAQLITSHAEPVIKGIIRYKLHLSPYHVTELAEADDLRQEGIVQLLAELQQFRQQPDAHPISDVRGLAAVIAHRACSGWMRRQFPERHALKNRLYYLLTHQKGFGLWQDEDRKLVAGFEIWQGQKKRATEEWGGQLSDDGGLIAQIRTLTTGRKKAVSGGALAAIFNHLGSPIEFDKLVGALVALLPIRDQPMESTEENEKAMELADARTPDPAWQVEKRIFLERLWEEVCCLPRNQRAALLLNLKDTEGGNCIVLFPATGIATFRQLAATLEMSAEQFAELWGRLPLEDARIAELLKLTRQQVINARKSARERLTRKLRGFI